MRLGIIGDDVGPPDYRDFIFDRIDEKYGSRYRFCGQPRDRRVERAPVRQEVVHNSPAGRASPPASSEKVSALIVASWADYLHQRARATVADRALETEIRAFLAEGESATMSHYIAER